MWWLFIRSDDDVSILQLIYEHRGGSAAPAQRQSLEQCGHWKSVVVITAEVALQCLFLAAASFWHQASLKIAAALWTEPRHFGLSMGYPSRSLGLMWHHGRLTVSSYRSFCLTWFLCQPGVPRTLGVSASDTPQFESHVQHIEVEPWWWWPLCWWT